MHKRFLIIAAISGALSVILGAFGAHTLKNLASVESVASFETGVRYQFYHTFALLFTAIIFEKNSSKWVSYAGSLFIVGILLFSGSLYILTLLKLTGQVGLKGVGLITPLGGLAFVAAWIALLIGILVGSGTAPRRG